MTKTTGHPVLKLVRRMIEDQRTRGFPDDELLRRLACSGDESSLEALLRRHGAMVLDVCQAVLPNEADVDDAFQATFIVLARKAATIRKPGSLPSWLHGVAYRIALRVRAEGARRRRREQNVLPVEPSVHEDLSWADVRRVLHEELARLAERYREPLSLCYLEGQTQDAAAIALNMPKGTLKRRLERGRAMLRARLVRRGLGSAALILCAWPSAGAAAPLPPTLIALTMRAASQIPPRLAHFVDAAIREMFLAKLKAPALVALLVTVVCLVSGGALYLQASDSGELRAEQRVAEADRALDDLPRVVDSLATQLQKNPVRQPPRVDRLGLYLLELKQRQARLVAAEVDEQRAYIGSPTWSHDGARILFDASPGKQFDQTRLHALTLAEGGVEMSNLGVGNCPTVSPDGKHIAFLLNAKVDPADVTGVHVMKADGTQRRRLGGFGIPKWSPDGRQLLIVGFSNPASLTVIDVDTGEERVVTLPDHRIYSVPSWANPGTLVAVVNSKAGTALALVDISAPDKATVKDVLWRVGDGLRVDPLYPVYWPRTKCCYFVGRDKEGQTLYQLEAGKRPERLEADQRDGKIASLALSPDGRYLLFCSDR